MNTELLNLNPKHEMVINHDSVRKSGLQAQWKSCNRIVAFASPNSQDTSLSSSQPPFCLFDVKWNLDMHCSIGRKLANESCLVFVAIQQFCQQVEDNLNLKEQLLKFSKNYRSILRSCFLELRLKSKDGKFEAEDSEQQMQLYNMMELIWSLCEILFIEKLPDGLVLARLMEWNKWHFPTADELTQECMSNQSESSPSSHPRYWDAIFALVLQGQLSEARNLLKLHPSFQTQVYDAFSSIDELLRKMPMFQHNQGQSVSEFEMKWHYWHDECVKRLRDGDFDTKPELKVICKILCGDDELIGELVDLCGSWYQVLISYLFYKNPAISMFDLHYHAKICIEMCGGYSELGALDNIFLAAFKFDVTQVIRECCDHLSSWWLPAHLADMLHHSQLLSLNSADSGGNLREYLLVEYASHLSGVDCYWKVVVDYLTHCGPQSDHYLPLFVQKIPLTSEKKAAKVLRLCNKRGWTEEAKSVCRQMCRRALQYNRLGTALSWAVKANDSSCSIYIADKMLEEYAETGTFSNLELIDYLGSSVLLSERLTFLVKYRDFHKLYMDEGFDKAAELLFNLIVHAKAPLHFWPSLLMDTLPLLENEKLFYNIDQTTQLLNCVNSLDEKQSELLIDFSDDAVERHLGKMKNLRLALTKNLAKAIACSK